MASNDERRTALEQLEVIADLSRYLPTFAAERCNAEVAATSARILELLSGSRDVSTPPPPGWAVAEGLRLLRSFERGQAPAPGVAGVQWRVSLSLALWRLLVRCAPGNPAPYGYSLRERLTKHLTKWLLRIARENVTPVWMDRPPPAETLEALGQLTEELDARLIVRMLLSEISTSFRVDTGCADGMRARFMAELMNLCKAVHRFLDVDTGELLVNELSPQLDSRYVDTMIFARLLVVLTPSGCVAPLVRSGRLWQWWSTMPEGLVPKFDLMWFALLSRYAKLRWAGRIDATGAAADAEAPAQVGCAEQLTRQLPFLLNKVYLLFQMPLCSPSASAACSKELQSLPGLDHFHIPHDLDTLMGPQSTWKKVAKFIVYMLDAQPPPADQGQSTAAGAEEDPLGLAVENPWSWLRVIMQHMQPFLRPGGAAGSWAWHCLTFTEHLVKVYFKRAARERLLPCRVPVANRLTQAADERFVALLLPLLNNCLQTSTYHTMAKALDILGEVFMLSAMQPRSPEAEPRGLNAGSAADSSVPAILARAVAALNDPTQSHRHTGYLQLLTRTMPALLLRWPETLGELLPVILWGIDATDLPKAFTSLNLLVTICSYIPSIDSNDWPAPASGDAHPSKRACRWPVAGGAGACDAACDDDAAARCLSSMLPAFVLDFFERISEFIVAMPKPPKGAGGGALGDMESAALSLVHSAMHLLAVQCDAGTYGRLLEAVGDFSRSRLLVDQAKPVSAVLSAVVRANPEQALPALLPPLLRKLMASADAASAKPLHEHGVSENEAKWFLSLVAGAVRHGGEALLPFRGQLEAVVKSAMADEHEDVTKLGLKLLRRILYSITATYVRSDFRGCSNEAWKALLAARSGGASAQQQSPLWPLKWWGWTSPWWSEEPPSIQWHVPSAQEVEWAESLVKGALGQAALLLRFPDAGQEESAAASTPQLGAGWLEGLQLPPKKTASHGVFLGLRLTRAMLRGTYEIWPDERTQAEASEKLLPVISAHPNTTGRLIFDSLTGVLHTAIIALRPYEQSGGTMEATKGGVLGGIGPVEVPKIFEELIQCVSALLRTSGNARSPSRLLPSMLWMPGGHDAMLVSSLDSAPLRSLHAFSKWRSVARIWWVLAVSGEWEARKRSYCSRYDYRGRRKQLIDALCGLAVDGGYMAVRHAATNALARALHAHKGTARPLLESKMIPALEEEAAAAAVAQRGNITGEAADKEQQRLNNRLEGIACTLTGALNLITTPWRRGSDDAGALALALCEVIYSATQRREAGATAAVEETGEKQQRCEVKAQTVGYLIRASQRWLEQRELLCGAAGSADSDDEEEEEGAAATAASSGGGDRRRGAPTEEERRTRTVEILNGILAICERPGCHWRAAVVATSVAVALLSSLRLHEATAETGPVRDLKQRWVRWLVKCSDPKNQPALHELSVHGLLFALKGGNFSDLREAGVFTSDFFHKLLKVLSQLQHMQLLHTAGGAAADPVDDSVTIVCSTCAFKIWPCTWVGQSHHSAFSVPNALVWQSYFVSLMRLREADAAGQALPAPEALLEEGAKYLAAQPAAEAEYQVSLCELIAGALRALRKSAARGTLEKTWLVLHEPLRSTLRGASQERLGEWCDGLRFIASGSARPLLRRILKGEAAAKAEDLQFLMPLFNFALDPEKSPDLKVLVPSAFLGRSSDAAGEAAAAAESEEGSSLAIFKRLRMLMSLVVEPTAMSLLEAEARYTNDLFESLRAGVGHPYKQLREEAARSLFLLLRAGSQEGATGLGGVVAGVETWLAEEAERLVPLLRQETAALHQEREGSRSTTVLESTGVCYVVLHTALERQAARLLGHALPRCLQFLLLAATHDDLELRALASQALALSSASHPVAPTPPPGGSGSAVAAAATAVGAAATGGVVALQALAALLRGGTLQGKDLEKAIFLAARPMLLTKVCVLACRVGGEAHGLRLFLDIRELVEAALGHKDHDVCKFAKATLVTVMALDSDAAIRRYLRRCGAKLGSGRRRGSAPAEGAPANATEGVLGLSSALLLAADRGSPPWTGEVIEKLAPYGRDSASSTSRKEVQSSFQLFLKLQQSSQQSWKELREKLTADQVDLLSEYKGGLSYFS